MKLLDIRPEYINEELGRFLIEMRLYCENWRVKIYILLIYKLN